MNQPLALAAAPAVAWRARWLPVLPLLALTLFPFLAPWLDLGYYVGFVRKLLILATSAAGLAFILGTAGLPSLGQAAFTGVGAYTAITLVESLGFTSFWLQGGAAVAAGAALAWVTGLVSVRTKGTYFIMITLAFAQMFYYFAVSLRMFGGDDGYTLAARPTLGFGLDASNETVWYFVVLSAAVLVYAALQRLTQARFGHALVGIRDNDARMSALGYPVFALKLTAFTIAGAVASGAGFLMLAESRFFSPASMHWTQSAVLLVMVVLGGNGRLWGAAIGVAVWSAAEESVRQATQYWHWPLGVALIIVVLLRGRSGGGGAA